MKRFVLYCVLCRRREKVVKTLQSNPFQFALCFIILLDAIIVIAQILIDINAVKGTRFIFYSTSVGLYQCSLRDTRRRVGETFTDMHAVTCMLVFACIFDM